MDLYFIVLLAQLSLCEKVSFCDRLLSGVRKLFIQNEIHEEFWLPWQPKAKSLKTLLQRHKCESLDNLPVA